MNRRDFIKQMRFIAAGGVAGYLCRNLGSPAPHIRDFVDVTITTTPGPKGFGDLIMPARETSKVKMYTSMNELVADGWFS